MSDVGSKLFQRTYEELWCTYLDRDPMMLMQEKVVRAALTDIGDLLEYIKVKNKIHEPQPYIEVIFKDSVLSLDMALQDVGKTSQRDSIKIVYKYIKYNDKCTRRFFEQRGIEFYKEILLRNKFDSCIQEISDTNFTITDSAYSAIAKNYKFISTTCDDAIHTIATQFFLAAFQDDEKNLVLLTPDKIEADTNEHEATADHIFFNTKSTKVLLICEDKQISIEDAVIQNFDLLRTYSLNSRGKSRSYIYGLATNIREWRFCCYVRQPTGKNVTADNFIVSEEIPTNFGSDDLPSRDCAQKIARIIRGFVTKNVDEIVSTKIASTSN